MGPTATGKTALAVETAKAINGEVISVDSALIYQDMNIGTAKPSEEEKQGIPHYLIDIISPQEQYSVADFVHDTNQCITDILGRKRVPILTGGTMMYFNALHHGISNIPEADKSVRQKIQIQIEHLGLSKMHERLQAVDPQSAAKIHPNDPQRITRALEVFESTAKPLSYWQAQKTDALPFDFVNFSIVPQNRSELHLRIEKRFEQMLEQGLLAEVKHLLNKYCLDADTPSMRSVGYRQVLQYFNDELSFEQMKERSVIATRQLAKRQLTWLNAWSDAHVLYMNNPSNLEEILQKVCVSTP
ncbi:tRNA (adenosine(37)-N6)-dimethylallyltransferase MiaA [Ningiella sp. W23]|uniref:tRNA (adenosine(37)-N6)-dimethylallyltransferase MiaA n=1 Tax=Ningiella sp. W23 TaxID=3023715 RepID=UPI003757FCC7